MATLPIDPILPRISEALARSGRAVLQAEPGAGKTTRVPLALMEAGAPGRIVMLEPRRLAARAAAERMAESLGEPVGQTVGYAMRGARKVSKATRIEVVTEGLLTRRIQSDPELSGVSTLIFDEFHERSLNADLGLALALEVAAALRPDLRILVMSATLEAGPVAGLLGGAPVISAEGRSFPVERRHLERPWRRPDGPRGARALGEAMAALIGRAAAETEGSILAFLPGEAEIRATRAALDLPASIAVHALFGAMPIEAQRAAIAPAPGGGRKLVLATSIAETSLTIEGIGVVVDAGLARRARFDPGSGMTRLVTERVTRAEATQREGRAGRLGPGVAYKLWTRGEEGALAAFPPPEILTADLAGLVLESAAWGATDPAALPFLDPPPEGGVAAARELLERLGALDGKGHITDHGRAMLALPAHPRLANMLLRGGPGAERIAALLEARDPLPRAAPAELALRLRALDAPRANAAEHPWAADPRALATIRAEAKRLRAALPGQPDAPVHPPEEQLALAYPDRIGLRRPGEAPRFLLANGKGATFTAKDPLGASRMIVAADLDGDATEARIRLAAPITEAQVKALFPERLSREAHIAWDRRLKRVVAVERLRLDALVLEERRLPEPDPLAVGAAMAEGIRALGLDCLPWSPRARRLRARIAWARTHGADLPAVDDEALLATLEEWLIPHLGARRSADNLASLDLAALLEARLGWQGRQTLDRIAPAAFTAPTGTRVPIDYASDPPKISLRLQELFGTGAHPTIGAERVPLLVELLSPAGRPVQTTADLPGFWATSYADVRKDMRGRYPRHPWPENPVTAAPTRRAKPRGQ